MYPANYDLNYTITFWFPPQNHTVIAPYLDHTVIGWMPQNFTAIASYGLSWTSCSYGQTIPVGLEYEEWLIYSYCVPVNSTAFIVTQPQYSGPH
ncbi:MAG: hypothetical protein ACREBS_01430 [Nitrososphaerales archaeon]